MQENGTEYRDYLHAAYDIRSTNKIEEKYRNYKRDGWHFSKGTFEVIEIVLSAYEVIPIKLALQAKLDSHGRLDKLKARLP